MKYNKNVQNQVFQEKIFENLPNKKVVGIFPPIQKKNKKNVRIMKGEEKESYIFIVHIIFNIAKPAI